MKKIRKNYIFIIILIFLLILGAVNIYTYKKYLKKDASVLNGYVELCKDENYRENNIDTCNMIDKAKIPNYDTATTFYTLINRWKLDGFIVFLSPLLVMILAMWQNQKEINSKYIKNHLTRDSYKKYLKKYMFNAYKSIWILPIFILFQFVCAYLISGHFDYSYSSKNSIATFDLQYLQNFKLFMFFYTLNFFIHSIFYANIAMICAKNSKNIIITILKSYLLFIGIEIILEVIIDGVIFTNIFGINLERLLTVLDIYSFHDKIGIMPYLFFELGITILSFIVLYLLYKNKEKVIIEWEK